MMRNSRETEVAVCPLCGSGRVLPIVYGLPTVEGFRAAERGEFILGGCIVGDATHECLECGHTWSVEGENGGRGAGSFRDFRSGRSRDGVSARPEFARSAEELLRCWAATMDALRESGVLRSGNNPVADYAEFLVARHFGVEREPPGHAAYDVEVSGERIQVKAIRESSRYQRTTLSTIRGVDTGSFDSIYVVRFSHDLTSWRTWRIPRELVRSYGRRVGPDAYRLEFTARLLMDPQVAEIGLLSPAPTAAL